MKKVFLLLLALTLVSLGCGAKKESPPAGGIFSMNLGTEPPTLD